MSTIKTDEWVKRIETELKDTPMSVIAELLLDIRNLLISIKINGQKTE